MKYRNRIFALLLSVMMVFTYMPAMAFAEGEEAAVVDVPAAEQAEESAVDKAEGQTGESGAKLTQEPSAAKTGDTSADQVEEKSANEADEPATVQEMHEFAEAQGYELDFSDTRLHHEIYLSDPRKTAPEKLRTVVRHPIRKKR